MLRAPERFGPTARSPTLKGSRELALFLAAYGLFDAARWLFRGDITQARVQSHSIIHLEHATGVAIEASVQQALGSPLWSWLLSNVYLAAQLAVLPGALLWLYRAAPRVDRSLRSTVLATWLIAVPIFALLPVAPPRLAGIGILDSVGRHAGVSLTGRSTIFYNPLAAIPSLHVGFAFAIGIAAAAARRAPWARAAALLLGPLVTVVIATGNHYVVDAVARLIVTATGYTVGRFLEPLLDVAHELLPLGAGPIALVPPDDFRTRDRLPAPMFTVESSCRRGCDRGVGDASFDAVRPWSVPRIASALTTKATARRAVGPSSAALLRRGRSGSDGQRGGAVPRWTNLSSRHAATRAESPLLL
jgi:PAP2 superfamily